MPTFNPTLPLERELGKQIYQALQGPVVETILKNGGQGRRCRRLLLAQPHGRALHEGGQRHPSGLLRPVPGRMHLDFKGPVDFYVTGESIEEFSQKFAEMIQRNYVPSLESIC